MASASEKRRKDVAELEHGLEHNGDIRLLPTSTARSYARPRSRRARRVQCAPITRTGRARLAAASYCPAPPRPPCRHAVPPRRHAVLRPRATTQRLGGLRGRRTYDVTARRLRHALRPPLEPCGSDTNCWRHLLAAAPFFYLLPHTRRNSTHTHAHMHQGRTHKLCQEAPLVITQWLHCFSSPHGRSFSFTWSL